MRLERPCPPRAFESLVEIGTFTDIQDAGDFLMLDQPTAFKAVVNELAN